MTAWLGTNKHGFDHCPCSKLFWFGSVVIGVLGAAVWCRYWNTIHYVTSTSPHALLFFTVGSSIVRDLVNMDAPGSPDMLSIGRNCAVKSCRQLDFLPFTCDACHEVYCLEHRQYQSHSCTKAGQKETTAIVCPLCAKAIKLSPDEDPNVAFERHTAEVQPESAKTVVCSQLWDAAAKQRMCCVCRPATLRTTQRCTGRPGAPARAAARS